MYEVDLLTSAGVRVSKIIFYIEVAVKMFSVYFLRIYSVGWEQRVNRVYMFCSVHVYMQTYDILHKITKIATFLGTCIYTSKPMIFYTKSQGTLFPGLFMSHTQ